jgi:hypothetical protein
MDVAAGAANSVLPAGILFVFEFVVGEGEGETSGTEDRKLLNERPRAKTGKRVKLQIVLPAIE